MYNSLKLKIRKEIQKAKIKWTRRLEEKELWKAVSSHLGRNSNSPLMSLLGKFSSVAEGIAAISNHLKSVFIASHGFTYDPGSLPQDSWSPEISSSVVYKMLSQLSPQKSSPDIPIVLYKNAASTLAEPLSKLIELSVEQGTVPSLWKRAKVTPIPKKSNPSIDDIRPISLLSPPAKILEKIVLKSIKYKLLENYDVNQFGFRPGSSTLSALTALHNHLTYYLDDSSTFGALLISYDYSKAFDRLRCDIIIERLVSCRFPHEIVKWLTDYLNNRTQVVKIGELEGGIVNISSGVPQGSILGPFLYSFATATYHPKTSLCKVVRYADDTSLILPLFKCSNNDHVSIEHDNLTNWSVENDLVMNIQKCKVLILQKPGIQHDLDFLPNLDIVDELKILGVIFNKTLTWKSHIGYSVKKCSRLLYAFRILRSILSSSSMKRLYISLVLPVIEYCAPIFVALSSTDSRRLTRLQSRFHRIICGSNCKNDCFDDLNERRLVLASDFLDKIRNPAHILHHYLPPLSKTGRFLLPSRRTEQRSRHVLLYACERANATIKR